MSDAVIGRVPNVGGGTGVASFDKPRTPEFGVVTPPMRPGGNGRGDTDGIVPGVVATGGGDGIVGTAASPPRSLGKSN